MLKTKTFLLVVAAITAVLCTNGCGPGKHNCTPVPGAKVMEFRVVTNDTDTSFSSKQIEELLMKDSALLGEPAKFVIHSAEPAKYVSMKMEDLPAEMRSIFAERSGWEVYFQLCENGLQSGNGITFKNFTKGANESQVAISVNGKFLNAPFFESEEGLYPRFSIGSPHDGLLAEESANLLAAKLTALVVESDSVFGKDSNLPSGKVVYSNSMTLIPTVGEFSMFLDDQGPTQLEPHYFSFQPGEHYPVIAQPWDSFGVGDEVFMIRASPSSNNVEFRKEGELACEWGLFFGDEEYAELKWEPFDKRTIFEDREIAYLCVHWSMPIELLTAAIIEGNEFGTKLVIMTSFKVIPDSMPEDD